MQKRQQCSGRSGFEHGAVIWISWAGSSGGLGRAARSQGRERGWSMAQPHKPGHVPCSHCHGMTSNPTRTTAALPTRTDKLRIQGPLGRVQSRLLPIITMLCLLLSLFSLPLCSWLLLNLFWSSRMIDQVCQIWRAGRNKLTHLNWYLHKISGYLYPSKTCMVRCYFKKMPGGRGSPYPLASAVVDYKFKANLSAAVQSVTRTGLEISFPYAFQIKVSLMHFSSCLWTFRVHWQQTEWLGTKETPLSFPPRELASGLNLLMDYRHPLM